MLPMRRLVVLIGILLVLIGFFDLLEKYGFTGLIHVPNSSIVQNGEKVKVVTEESVVVDTVKQYGPSVVTVAESLPQSNSFDLGPFSFFGPQSQGGQNQQQ